MAHSGESNIILAPMSPDVREERIRRDGIGYWDRLAALYEALDEHSPTTCAELAAAIGWASTEVRAKLRALRTLGLADYAGGEWWWEGDE